MCLMRKKCSRVIHSQKGAYVVCKCLYMPTVYVKMCIVDKRKTERERERQREGKIASNLSNSKDCSSQSHFLGNS